MKSPKQLTTFTLVTVAAVAAWLVSRAAEGPKAATFEYASIRWDGPENTHIIRPDGTVQSVGAQLRDLRVPQRTDARCFYMNTVLNALAREGYELVTMHPDVLIVKRAVH